ncbi:MAG: hypothetical protein ACRDXE_08220 [Acidimicrobiales bacterium]
MGTNFYVAETSRGAGDESDGHIGKRVAAGPYCWDCRRTFCPGGDAAVHDGGSWPWPKTCPGCGQPATDRRACSFSWATDPGAVEGIREVEDEYGDKMSVVAFVRMLEECCPIRFTDLVGRRFC